MDSNYRLIKQSYKNNGSDFTKLFQTILSVANEVGMDKSLEYLEKCVIEKRLSWLDKNLDKIEKSENSITDAYKIFYEIYLGISAPKDGKIIKKTNKKLITRWWNYCPVLEACKKFNLDTRTVCKNAYHNPSQIFISKINSKLKFDRNYNCIRPYTPYCEEIITLQE